MAREKRSLIFFLGMVWFDMLEVCREIMILRPVLSDISQMTSRFAGIIPTYTLAGIAARFGLHDNWVSRITQGTEKKARKKT